MEREEKNRGRSDEKDDIAEALAAFTTLISSGKIDTGLILAQAEVEENMNLINSYEYKMFESGGFWYVKIARRKTV